MIAGGTIEGQSYVKSVMEYDIIANTYNSIQSLPKNIRRTTLVNRNGYMYSFGGFRNDNRAAVFRISLTLTTDTVLLTWPKFRSHFMNQLT